VGPRQGRPLYDLGGQLPTDRTGWVAGQIQLRARRVCGFVTQRLHLAPCGCRSLNADSSVPCTTGASKTLYFDTDGVAEALSSYIETEVQWEEMERQVLCLLIRRAFDEEKAKKQKSSAQLFIEWSVSKDWPLSIGFVISMMIGFAAWLIPRVIGIGAAVLITVGLWSMDHLHAGQSYYLALFGLGWVTAGVVSWGVYLGTSETRNRLKPMARPNDADDKTEKIFIPELRVLEQTVNFHRIPHINLRFVRELLARCISQGAKTPVQMLTLIDRLQRVVTTGRRRLLIAVVEGAIDEDAVVIARRRGLTWLLWRHVRRPCAH
jgi:hypothetical protein